MSIDCSGCDHKLTPSCPVPILKREISSGAAENCEFSSIYKKPTFASIYCPLCSTAIVFDEKLKRCSCGYVAHIKQAGFPPKKLYPHTLADCQNWSCPSYERDEKRCLKDQDPLNCERYLMDQLRTVVNNKDKEIDQLKNKLNRSFYLPKSAFESCSEIHPITTELGMHAICHNILTCPCPKYKQISKQE